MNNNIKYKYDIDYNVLKSSIIKCCSQCHHGSNEFKIDNIKLSKTVDDIGLKFINTDIKHLADNITRSRLIRFNDIFTIQEYFKGAKLSWFSSDKEFTQLLFVRSDSDDKELNNMVEKINSLDPNKCEDDEDMLKTVFKIIAEYPCYFATVVSYISNDPGREGRNTYVISCRANLVAISQENYKYNEKDI